MQPLFTSKYGHQTWPTTQADQRFPLTWSNNGLSMCWHQCSHIQAAWAVSDSTIRGSACLLLLFTPLTGGLLRTHCLSLTAVCSPAPFRALLCLSYLQASTGRAPHTCLSGRMELLEQMERRRKLKVTDVCQGGWYWRLLRHVILITLKLVVFFFVSLFLGHICCF